MSEHLHGNGSLALLTVHQVDDLISAVQKLTFSVNALNDTMRKEINRRAAEVSDAIARRNARNTKRRVTKVG